MKPILTILERNFIKTIRSSSMNNEHTTISTEPRIAQIRASQSLSKVQPLNKLLYHTRISSFYDPINITLINKSEPRNQCIWEMCYHLSSQGK